MQEPVILGAIRSPIGRKDGTLSSIRPDEIYAQTLNGLLRATKIDPQKVEDLVTGCVTQAGEQGANIGRISVLLSDLPKEVSAVTLNRMCGSSQQAIHFAAQVVAAGDSKYLIAGGVESMSRAPMFSDIKGSFETLNPALHKKYEIIHQGESAERIAEKYKLSRNVLDEFSRESHRRAATATQAKYFDAQILPMEGKDKEGKTVTLRWDEGIRATLDPEKMAKLPTIFRPTGGVVTAANASQISDGAGAILIGDKAAALADGLKPRARFRARVAVGGDPTLQLMEVVPATKKALERAGLSMRDIDVIEINEAFASVVLGWAAELKPDMNKVNPNGGAIAHGHPLGATGAILLTKLLHELERTDKQFGLQVMCIGHGMATATIIERV